MGYYITILEKFENFFEILKNFYVSDKIYFRNFVVPKKYINFTMEGKVYEGKDKKARH